MATKPRALKTVEEIRAVPLDQPVLVELPSGVEPAEPEKKAEPERKEPPKEDAAARLQAQLETMQRAHDADKQRLAAERDAAIEAARVAREQQSTSDQQLNTTSLARAQSDIAAAKLAYKTAMESGDYAAAGDAQEKLSRASAMVLNLEGAAAQAAVEPKEPPKPVQQSAPQFTSVSEAVEMSPQLLPSEKEWIKKHPETWSDRKMNVRLEDGYNRAMDKGLQRGTDAYLEFLDQHMGYAQADEGNGEDNTMAAAPVSRQTNSLSGQPVQSDGQIMLSPEQREFCATNGINEVTYARNVQRLAKEKKINPEKYGRTS